MIVKKSNIIGREPEITALKRIYPKRLEVGWDPEKQMKVSIVC